MQSQVRFSRVSEKVLEKVWEALVQSQVRSNRVPEKVPGEGLGDFGARQVRFNRVAEEVPEKVPGSLGARPNQVQQGSGEGFRRRFREALCRGRSGSTGFWRRFRRRSGRLWSRLRCFQRLAS